MEKLPGQEQVPCMVFQDRLRHSGTSNSALFLVPVRTEADLDLPKHAGVLFELHFPLFQCSNQAISGKKMVCTGYFPEVKRSESQGVGVLRLSPGYIYPMAVFAIMQIDAFTVAVFIGRLYAVPVAPDFHKGKPCTYQFAAKNTCICCYIGVPHPVHGLVH